MDDSAPNLKSEQILTKNQKKKRRQKLSRLYKPAKTSDTEVLYAPRKTQAHTVAEQFFKAALDSHRQPTHINFSYLMQETSVPADSNTNPYYARDEEHSLANTTSLYTEHAAPSLYNWQQHQRQQQQYPTAIDPYYSSHKQQHTYFSDSGIHQTLSHPQSEAEEARQQDNQPIETAAAQMPQEQQQQQRPPSVCRADLTQAAVLIQAQLLGTQPPLQLPTWQQQQQHVYTNQAAAAPSHSAEHSSPAIQQQPEASHSLSDVHSTAPYPPPQQQQHDTIGRFVPPLAAKSLKHTTTTTSTKTKVFVHGNYHRYYGYRPTDEDPRLALFDRHWFAGKRCMDIGCNEGLITLAIVMRFGPSSMVGIDIDEQLVRKACTNLKKERSTAETRAAAARQRGIDASERKSARTALSSLTHTWFLHGDIMSSDVADASCDMITALSMTKWVHLHVGDEGLKAMFVKVHQALAPGGLFLVEPQPWKSYQNASAKLRKEHAVPVGSWFNRLHELVFRPEQFADYLCDELGFRMIKRMNIDNSNKHGFDRPLYLFRKAS